MSELDHREGYTPRNWYFQITVLDKTLERPWTARRSSQSILKKINPEYSLERLTLKLQYFGHLMQRGNSLEKTVMLGKIEGRRRRGWQRTRWLDGIANSMDMNLSKLQEIAKDRGTQHAAVHGVVKCQTQLSNWKTITIIVIMTAIIYCIPNHVLGKNMNDFSYSQLDHTTTLEDSRLPHVRIKTRAKQLIPNLLFIV